MVLRPQSILVGEDASWYTKTLRQKEKQTSQSQPFGGMSFLRMTREGGLGPTAQQNKPPNMIDHPPYPRCVYLAWPAEIMAHSETNYSLFWGDVAVAEFSCQEAAELYLESEFCHTL